MKRPGLKTVAVGLFVTIALLCRPCLAPGQRAETLPASKSPAKEPGNAEQIDRFIRQLGSANFDEREAASKAPDALGETALPALRKAQDSSDLEIRRRAVHLVKILTQRRAPMRDKAWNTLKKLTARIDSDTGTPKGEMGVIDLSSAIKVRDADLALLQWLDDAEGLCLLGTQITDAGLTHCKKLYKLKILDLGETKITDAGLEHLAKLTTLTHLVIYNTRVTDAGLPHLKNLNRLIYLDLSNLPVTDEGLASLKKLHELRTLWLNGTKVTDKGIADLRKALPKLATLVR